MRQDLDPVETQEWLDALDSVLEFEGAERASFLLDELLGQALRSWGVGSVFGGHPVCEHDPGGSAAGVSGGSGDRAADPVDDPVERGGDRVAGEQGVVGAGRAYRLVPVRGDVV